MKSLKKITLAISIFFVVFAVRGIAFADPSNSSGQATVSATSANWSGYVATSGTYTGVSGTFVMPELSYSATLASNATWVGIGGKPGSSDLIQAGVYEIANSDGAIYQAWYELLPDDSTPIDLPVHPYDSISVAILQTSPGTWNIVITNNTTKQQFEKTVNYQSSLSSADWIQERPLVDGTFSDLSGYTPVAFSGATAVQNGIRVTMAQAGAQMVNLVDMSTNTALSVPSPISTDGMSFTVYRTNASSSSSTITAPVVPAPTPIESIIPPFELHRTGRIIVPLTPPGVTWVIQFHPKK
jgi:hypothetical protein